MPLNTLSWVHEVRVVPRSLGHTLLTSVAHFCHTSCICVHDIQDKNLNAYHNKHSEVPGSVLFARLAEQVVADDVDQPGTELVLPSHYHVNAVRRDRRQPAPDRLAHNTR